MKNNISYIKYTISRFVLILLVILPTYLYAQQNPITVSGVVKDKTGLTLPSASVTLKGDTKVGVLTDQKGEFKITVPEGSTLIFSFIGMKTQEITVNKKKLTYTTVKCDDIRVAGINQLDAALQGLIPGVSITLPSGMIGTAAQVRVRGTSTSWVMLLPFGWLMV